MKNINQIQEAFSLLGVVQQYMPDDSIRGNVNLHLTTLAWILDHPNDFDKLLEIARRFMVQASDGKPAVLVYADCTPGTMPPDDAPRWTYGPEAPKRT